MASGDTGYEDFHRSASMANRVEFTDDEEEIGPEFRERGSQRTSFMSRNARFFAGTHLDPNSHLDVEANEAEGVFEEAAELARIHCSIQEKRNRRFKQGLLCASSLLVTTFVIIAISVSITARKKSAIVNQGVSNSLLMANNGAKVADNLNNTEGLESGEAFTLPSPPSDLEKWCEGGVLDLDQCHSACLVAQCCFNLQFPNLDGETSDSQTQSSSSCFTNENKKLCEEYSTCFNLFLKKHNSSVEENPELTPALMDQNPELSQAILDFENDEEETLKNRASVQVDPAPDDLSETCSDTVVIASPDLREACEQACIQGACCYDDSCENDNYVSICEQYQVCWSLPFVIDLIEFVFPGMKKYDVETNEMLENGMLTNDIQNNESEGPEQETPLNSNLIDTEALMNCGNEDYLSDQENFQKCYEACRPVECCFHPKQHGSHFESGNDCDDDFYEENSCHKLIFCSEVFDKYKSQATSKPAAEYADTEIDSIDSNVENQADLLDTGDENVESPSLKSDFEFDSLNDEISKLLEGENDNPDVDDGESASMLPSQTDPDITFEFNHVNVDALCSNESLSSDEGLRNCQDACKDFSCCFNDGNSDPCDFSTMIQCNTFQSCEVAFNLSIRTEILVQACDPNAISTSQPAFDLCLEACQPYACCYHAKEDCETFKANSHCSGTQPCSLVFQQEEASDVESNSGDLTLSNDPKPKAEDEQQFEDIIANAIEESINQEVDGGVQVQEQTQDSPSISENLPSNFNSFISGGIDEEAFEESENPDFEDKATNISEFSIKPSFEEENALTDTSESSSEAENSSLELQVTDEQASGLSTQTLSTAGSLPILEACSSENLSTENGVVACAKICASRACCFQKGALNCYEDETAEWCDQYAVCKVFYD